MVCPFRYLANSRDFNKSSIVTNHVLKALSTHNSTNTNIISTNFVDDLLTNREALVFIWMFMFIITQVSLKTVWTRFLHIVQDVYRTTTISYYTVLVVLSRNYNSRAFLLDQGIGC